LAARREFDQRAGAIEALLRTLESAADPEVRAAARKLVTVLMDLHAAGLRRVIELAGEADAAGTALIDCFAGDPVVKHLLVLHGLHPCPRDLRLHEAIEDARPLLEAKGARLDRIVVGEDGAVVVMLRLDGHSPRHGMSSLGLEAIVSDAVYEAAPDITSLTVQVQEPPAFVPIGSVLRRSTDGSVGSSAPARPVGALP
jgi:hypothetical protein